MPEEKVTKVLALADSIFGNKFTSKHEFMFRQYDTDIESAITLLHFVIDTEMSVDYRESKVYAGAEAGSLVYDWANSDYSLVITAIANKNNLQITVSRNCEKILTSDYTIKDIYTTATHCWFKEYLKCLMSKTKI
jgi:hypothetical protein